MESYKRQKIIKIVREIQYSGNKYQINGIDLTKAIFFIKKGRELFKLVANGDFAITHEGTNTYLNINSAILISVISVQIGYELNTLSGKYEVSSDPDINILKDKYNALVDDFKNLWDYVQKQTLVSDTLSMELILPKLENGETWVYKDNEMKAIILYDAIEELKKSVEQVRQDTLNELQAKINGFNTHINNLMSDFRTEITNAVNTGKAELNNIISKFNSDWAILVANSRTEITNLTNSSKTDINTLVNNQKTTITELTNTSKDEINTLVTNQKNSITTLVDSSKIEINNVSNTQITSITNLASSSKAEMVALANNEKTEISDLAEDKKDEIRALATTIIGFDPLNYLQIGTSKYTTAKQIEDDIKNIKVTPTTTTLFEGLKPIMGEGFANGIFTNLLNGVTYGILRIRFNTNFIFEINIEELSMGVELYMPLERTNRPSFLFFTASRLGNDLKISTDVYTGITESKITKITLTK